MHNSGDVLHLDHMERLGAVQVILINLNLSMDK